MKKEAAACRHTLAAAPTRPPKAFKSNINSVKVNITHPVDDLAGRGGARGGLEGQAPQRIVDVV